MDLRFLQIEANLVPADALCILCADDRADRAARAGLARRDDRRVASHDLDADERAAHRRVVAHAESLRPDADGDGSVGNARELHHRVAGDIQLSASDLAVKDVDRRRAEKLGHEQVVRVVIDLLGLALLLQDALLHHDDHVGDAHGLLLVVRDEHGRDAGLALDAADLLAGLQTQARVEVRQRLVEQEHARRFDQGARDRHALLLAAGHLAGLALEQLFDLDELRRGEHLFLHGLLAQLRLAAQILQREEDVLAHGQMRIEGIILENQTDAALFGRQCGHIVFAEEDLARCRRFKPADEIERGALAAAGGTEQADELPVRDLEGHVVYGDDLALILFVEAGKFLGEVLQYDFHTAYHLKIG